MWRFKGFIDFDKEEKWLEGLAKQGYHLESVFFVYKFRLAEPEEATIKIDFRRFTKQEDFIDYCTLFEDSGWKHMAGTRWSGTQYFKKVDGESEDDIFSDEISRAGKYKRFSNMFIKLVIIYCLLFLKTFDNMNLHAIENPKLLYLTPGLWDLTGTEFWRAFLFETPFALFRGISWLAIPVMIILCIFCGFKANKLYEKSKVM